jgi:hypothetical protein
MDLGLAALGLGEGLRAGDVGQGGVAVLPGTPAGSSV